MKRVALIGVVLALVLGGCGNKVSVSEGTGVPLCSDVLSGAAMLPADNKCIDDG